jgi:hypothetical protein
VQRSIFLWRANILVLSWKKGNVVLRPKYTDGAQPPQIYTIAEFPHRNEWREVIDVTDLLEVLVLLVVLQLDSPHLLPPPGHQTGHLRSLALLVSP